MNIPLYQEVYTQIRADILSGKYAPNDVIPSERQLSETFKVSQITIRRAINELVMDGLIQKRQGIGNIVRNSVNQVRLEMSSFALDVTVGRLKLVRTLLVDEMTPASFELAQRLELQPGYLLRHLLRLDTEGGMPFSVDEVFLKPSLATSITPEIASSTLFLNLWQKTSEIRLVSVKYEICVQMPDKRDQELLQISADFPLMVTGELFCDKKGRPSIWIISRYRSDRCCLVGNYVLVSRETDQGMVGE